MIDNAQQCEAEAVAERLRCRIEDEPFRLSDGAPLTVTVSIGAALCQDNELPEELIERADRALYAAKRAGRNRVVTATSDQRPATPALHIV